MAAILHFNAHILLYFFSFANDITCLFYNLIQTKEIMLDKTKFEQFLGRVQNGSESSRDNLMIEFVPL